MAEVIESKDSLTLQLSFLEKLGAFHASLTAPQSSLKNTFIVENPWKGKNLLRGVRAPGTGIPFVILLGTLRGKNYKDFAAVVGRGAVKVYEFENQPFERWIVSIHE